MAHGGASPPPPSSSSDDEDDQKSWMRRREEAALDALDLHDHFDLDFDFDHLDLDFDFFLKSQKEMIRNVKGGTERRFDCRIIVMGHLKAGKTTLILRFLRKHFDMKKIERTNGIVITLKGAVLQQNRMWTITENPKDSDVVLRKMKTAKSKDVPTAEEKSFTYQEVSGADDIIYEIKMIKKETKELWEDEATIYKVSFVDFAGQSVFNSTHQMFLSKRAIYFLVFDISRDLESEVEDDDVHCLGVNQRMTVSGLTEFLLSSIHACSRDQTEPYPTVLLIGTHKDKVHETTAKERMAKLKNKFRDTPLQKHLRGDFLVDLSEKEDKEVDRLRQFVFEIAEQEPYWGEKTPTRWLPLEKDIIQKRAIGRRVLTLKRIGKMNSKCFVKLESKDEIEEFLRFHNGLGNLMYFGGSAPDVIVILDPQWLTDALKQFITFDQFYRIPDGFKEQWNAFINCAKLSTELIEAVWSLNEDTSFITHKDQLLSILEQTDIIASPLVYNKDGEAETSSYYFVPSMLKPKQEGINKAKALLRLCEAKSPTLCVVFNDKFMQPAIFSRLQAAFTTIYKIKEAQKIPLIFYQIAVFRLNQELDFVIEHVGYVIKITVINESGKNINPDLCENLRLILENSLAIILKLYGGCRLPFQLAIQCEKDSTNIDAVLFWNELEETERMICKAHHEEQWHKVCTEEVLGPWKARKVIDREEQIYSQQDYTTTKRGLNLNQLGRLARRVALFEEMLLAARVTVPESDLKKSHHDNKDDIVGNVFETLKRWRELEGGLTLQVIQKALGEKNIRIEQLQSAVADHDSSEYLKDFDPAFLEKKVNDQSIDLISQRSAKRYRFLALELKIQNHVIDTANQDIDGVVRRAKFLLNLWRSSCSRPTYREIGHAIAQVDMDRLLLLECQDSVMRKTRDVN